MPRKEISLLLRDLGFYMTGRSDVKQADWPLDPWLYPLDWSYQLDRPEDYFVPFDKAGVPLRDLPGKIDRSYLPSRIAAYALANWNRMRSDQASPANRVGFLVCADWFAKQPDGAFRHDFSVAGLEPGWLSCIAQGEGISSLVRARVVTGDDRYTEAVEQAFSWLNCSVAGGGLCESLPSGEPFLEEYPGSQYRHVLNGCLYALVGVHDITRTGFGPVSDAVALRDAVLDGIESNLSRWEIGNWTTYDFQPLTEPRARLNPNTLTYQTLHWILLDYLGRETSRPALVDAAQRWKSAVGSLPARGNALFGKLRFRMGHGY